MDQQEQEILLDFASEALGVDRVQAKSSLLNDDGTLKSEAKSYLLETHKTKVKGLKDATWSDAYSKAKKEERAAFEKEVKEKFGFSSDAIGIALIEGLITSKTPTGDGISEDVIKKHPAYISLETSLTAKVNDAVKVVEDKYKAELSKGEQDKANQYIIKQARTLLDGMKPLLPKDAKKQEAQLSFFDQTVLRLKFELKKVGDKQNILLVDPETGKRLEDEHGNAVKYEDKIKEIAESLYEFEEAEKRTAAGDPNKKGAAKKGADGDYKFTLTKPLNDVQYRTMLAQIDTDKTIDVKERIAKKAALKVLYRGEAS